MQIKIFPTLEAMAQTAAEEAATALRDAITANGTARLIAATGAAQFRFLELLTAKRGIAWDKVELFHLDEYIGLPDDHPASFVRFLKERLIEKTRIKTAHLMGGLGDPRETIRKFTDEIRKRSIDVAFIGIGENGHLAFNDPPADFDTDESFIMVELDEPCRQQQFGEGWFPSFNDVPKTAISMTVKEILKAKKIFAIVPEKRKAKAVAECFEGGIDPMHPASILRVQSNATVYMDTDSASELTPETIERYR
jgi:glucosamine-6-phosphate deaminase